MIISMHLISELSDRLKVVSQKMGEDKMVTKRDLSMIESVLFLQAINQFAGKRKASEALSTSIDTINKYIDCLEQDLGVKLISSSGRGSSLTSAAQKIVSKTAKIREFLDTTKIAQSGVYWNINNPALKIAELRTKMKNSIQNSDTQTSNYHPTKIAKNSITLPNNKQSREIS